MHLSETWGKNTLDKTVLKKKLKKTPHHKKTKTKHDVLLSENCAQDMQYIFFYNKPKCNVNFNQETCMIGNLVL